MKKVKLTTYAKLNDVTPRTVWNWIKKGLVKYERTETNRENNRRNEKRSTITINDSK